MTAFLHGQSKIPDMQRAIVLRLRNSKATTQVFYYVVSLRCWSYANGLWHDAGVLLGIQSMLFVIFNWFMT